LELLVREVLGGRREKINEKIMKKRSEKFPKFLLLALISISLPIEKECSPSFRLVSQFAVYTSLRRLKGEK